MQIQITPQQLAAEISRREAALEAVGKTQKQLEAAHAALKSALERAEEIQIEDSTPDRQLLLATARMLEPLASIALHQIEATRQGLEQSISEMKRAFLIAMPGDGKRQ
jgi:succinate dehydrogenase/fumarate reductase flavoprotein subunit